MDTVTYAGGIEGTAWVAMFDGTVWLRPDHIVDATEMIEPKIVGRWNTQKSGKEARKNNGYKPYSWHYISYDDGTWRCSHNNSLSQGINIYHPIYVPCDEWGRSADNPERMEEEAAAKKPIDWAKPIVVVDEDGKAHATKGKPAGQGLYQVDDTIRYGFGWTCDMRGQIIGSDCYVRNAVPSEYDPAYHGYPPEEWIDTDGQGNKMRWAMDGDDGIWFFVNTKCYVLNFPTTGSVSPSQHTIFDMTRTGISFFPCDRDGKRGEAKPDAVDLSKPIEYVDPSGNPSPGKLIDDCCAFMHNKVFYYAIQTESGCVYCFNKRGEVFGDCYGKNRVRNVGGK